MECSHYGEDALHAECMAACKYGGDYYDNYEEYCELECSYYEDKAL